MTVYGHPKLGATKRFPQGHLNKDDEGELRLAVFAIGSVIRVEFGTQLSWLGLDAASARNLADVLTKVADEAEHGGRA